MSVLVARDLVKTYPNRRILDGVSLAVGPGRRIGVVGDNGVGKTTLLRLLAGAETPDSGEVQRPDDLGFLPQQPPFSAGQTMRDVLRAALAVFERVELRMEELSTLLAEEPDADGALAAYGRLLTWAEDHELWDVEHRLDRVLAGLGLADLPRGRAVSTLSGGQRSRLALAVLLLRQPRALVLDEPTNHLDDAAAEFVQRHVAELRGAVVLASHDRTFLDSVCTDLVDVDPAWGGLTRYGGNYSDYRAEKTAALARWRQRHAAEQQELARLTDLARGSAHRVGQHKPRGNMSKLAYDHHGGRVQKQVSRRVRDARRRLDELTRAQVRKPPQPLRFAGELTEPSGAVDDVPVRVRDATLSGRVHCAYLDLPGSGTLLVTGPNGCGKSSLLAMLAGAVAPTSGTVAHRCGLRIGMLPQDVAFDDSSRTARARYAEATAGRDDVPNLVDLGLVAPADVDRPIGTLSVGGQRRLALALLIAQPPHLLLLDEPTNHLSPMLADELEDALRAAPGAVVVASHDRWLRSRWQGEVVALDEHRSVRHAGQGTEPAWRN